MTHPSDYPSKWIGDRKRQGGHILTMYEIARPLSSKLKGDYHISCPFGYKNDTGSHLKYWNDMGSHLKY